jgi:MFS family permease
LIISVTVAVRYTLYLQIKCEWNLTAGQESWVTSAVFIGMMLGSYTWGCLSDAFGRRMGFFAPACFTAIVGVLSAFSPNFPVSFLLPMLEVLHFGHVYCAHAAG